MKINPVRGILFAGALCALVLTVRAQHVTLRATINQAQENPPTGSPATGLAIMRYYPASNTFDLDLTITGLNNTATNSHIHEAAVGVNGPVVTGFGNESIANYVRTGNTLRGSFSGVRHLGSPTTLLSGGAYYNLHTAQFPGGEVRGQFIADPVRLVANMTIAQEAASNPTLNFAGLNDFGGAIMYYNPTTNQMSLRLSIFNFRNTLTNSHFHEAAPGVNGGVVVGLGAGTVTGYTITPANGYISGTFDLPYTGATPAVVPDPIKLLTGGAYLNFHSNTFAGGELRGQVTMSTETPSTRVANVALRGSVGTGDAVLIGGVVISGEEPVRVLITAKGPSLTALGVAGALANPRLALHDSAGREIATNDDIGTIAAGSELAAIPWVPRTAAEAALVVVLPPGNYTAIVSAAAGTGVALLEVYDLRGLPVAAGPN